jgi:pimeloyl-ACP methyl ester carboxylesterase
MTFVEKSFVTRDKLRLSYRDYAGPAGATVLLCLPGSTGTVRNFEDVAPDWARSRRVLCLDWRGHGRSDYDPDYRNYRFQTDADDVLELLRHEGLDRVAIVGTSRGGIVSFVLAEQRPGVLAGVVLNDIGPVSGGVGRQRLNRNFETPRSFATFEEAGAFMKRTQVPGITWTDAEWTKRATEFYRRREDGRIWADVDQGYIKAFREIPARDQWSGFAAMARLPVLAIRGALSDILDQPTLDEMRRRKPDLGVVVVAGRAHCPTLGEPEAAAAIEDFLRKI